MNLLHDIYYNPSHPASFGGVEKLANAVRGKISRAKVITWLKSQTPYNMHIPIRHKLKRRHYNLNNIDQLWESDLVDLKSLKSYNDNFSYLLVVIDAVSKYVWVEPLRDKTTLEVKNAFERILKGKEKRFPMCLQTDKGKEFVGRVFQKFLSDCKIIFRTTRDPNVKAAIVERFNRTLKERMWRYFTHHNTRRYIDVLQNIVHAYNNTRHSSIGMAPSAVNLDNAAIAVSNIQRKYSIKSLKGKKPKYKTGDLVRISRERGVFEKGYEVGWTEEFFVIKRVINSSRQSTCVYELKDLAGETIDGLFYERELSEVIKEDNEDNDKEYIIERVIRKKGKGSKQQYFVKWAGYPDKFNSWIPASDLKVLK